MNSSRALAASLSLGLLLACTVRKAEAPAPAAAPPGSAEARKPAAQQEPVVQPKPAAPQKSAAQPSKLTGAVSEEEFKALHVLRTDSPPPRRGAMIEIAKSRAYLSLPEDAKPPLAGIVVIHEWWGLNDNIMHWADRLAADGYAAVAVDLYGGVVATTPEQAMAAMKAVDDERAKEILLAAHRFLKEDPRVRAKKRGCIGWCFGGGKSLELALAAPDLDAAVMYYGHPVTDPKELEPLRAPLLGVFGARDRSITPEIVKEFDEALTQAGKEHKIQSYDAEHAFANPSSGRYDEKSAAAAWSEVRAFFAQRLAGGS